MPPISGRPQQQGFVLFVLSGLRNGDKRQQDGRPGVKRMAPAVCGSTAHRPWWWGLLERTPQLQYPFAGEQVSPQTYNVSKTYVCCPFSARISWTWIAGWSRYASRSSETTWRLGTLVRWSPFFWRRPANSYHCLTRRATCMCGRHLTRSSSSAPW